MCESPINSNSLLEEIYTLTFFDLFKVEAKNRKTTPNYLLVPCIIDEVETWSLAFVSLPLRGKGS